MPWNVTGHEWAANLLAQHIANGEVRHAYLFAGPPGVGRRTLALRFAQAINCQNPPAPGQFCGACRTCAQLERMQQPDLTVVQSIQEGAELPVDAIRAMQHSLSLAPYESRCRVALLLRFQEANDNAQNALLKTLEEAPDKAILLLTVDSPEMLLPTIVSRCEILRLRPLPIETVQASLAARGVSPEQADLLAHISGGRPGYAIRLSQNPDLLKQRQEWLEDLWRLVYASRRERLAYAGRIAAATGRSKEDRDKVRETLRDVMLAWLSFWRDVLLRAAGSSAPLGNPDQAGRIDRLAVETGLTGAREQIAALENALPLLKKANLALLMESLLLCWPRLK